MRPLSQYLRLLRNLRWFDPCEWRSLQYCETAQEIFELGTPSDKNESDFPLGNIAGRQSCQRLARADEQTEGGPAARIKPLA